ncbi:MAG TPA: hypothetical protein VK484_13240 [Ferruginibacter sp.]|nr:hypothetical protein [Ferruginibacter sp.]
MNKLTLSIFIFLSAPLFICAQKKRTENFQFTLSGQKIQNSFYNSIRLIDARYDTASVGIIQRGVFNDRVTLVAKQPLGEQA